MPELQFKGKEFVYNHHLTVPFRPLLIDSPALDGNPIIHGDNLHALTSLPPTRADDLNGGAINVPKRF